MDPYQFREYIVVPACKGLGPKYASKAAIRLLMATAAQETHLAQYVRQMNHGKGRGPFQMEPATLDDLYTNGLDGRVSLLPPKSAARLVYDLRYATKVARLQYYRFPEQLPLPGDVDGMFTYYKKHWNSKAGAATHNKFVTNWKKYVAAAESDT